jgi:hypothetical protein
MIAKSDAPLLPFLARFAKPIPDATPEPIRYDKNRQIAQVQVSGAWVDAADAPGTPRLTRCTKVAHETTDAQ